MTATNRNIEAMTAAMTADDHRARGEILAARAANGCRHEPDPDTAGTSYLYAELFDARARAVDVARCRHCGRWYEIGARDPGLFELEELEEMEENR